MGQGNALVSHIFSQKKCELKLTRYVVIDEVSFRDVEGNGFVALLHKLHPRFRIPDRKKISGLVYDLFLVEKAKIRSVIVEQRVSITTDTWTSIQNINYMVVTVHFLDGDWKPHKRIINFTKITSHNGEEIGKMVEVCLREWGIEKFFSIVVNNASSNNAAIDYLKRRMKSENSLLFEGKYLHMRCVCHILNLIVKDELKELDSSIKAIKNSIIFIYSSPSRLNKFREFAVLAKFSITSTISTDVKTRWNSTYKMLEVALKYRRVFERMFINYFHEEDENCKKRLGPPIADDWENAKAFVHFLQKFYDATLELSASKSPTSQLIYQSLIALQLEIERKRLDVSDPTLKKVAHAMKLKIDKYWANWDNMNPSIFIDNVLDPRNKFQMIKVSIKKFGGTATRIQEFVNKVKLELVNLWMDMQLECDDGGGGTSSAGGGLCDELFDDVDVRNEEEQLLEISNEVDKYLADEIEKRSNQYFNLLEWWKGNENRYPIISIIAKDIFAIPSSTVANEATFNLGKRVVDPFRSCLSPKMVEALVCTSDSLRAEDFSFWKDPTDDDIKLYKEIEEIKKSKSFFYLSLNVYNFC
ncbi:hypothetical protein F511_34118 [Dorcoceras hygrometricum]|uniref:Zinc finger BED domain-containing protein RICESLEEPER 2-like n=1 Tax=Dorcoceras hygrometricum TaxID=472368 RepID=A0A2Z7B0Y4_9LAMI|nr:hypothetical protein F511_34118 [Dorcoceras hygrometricum]